MDREKRMEMEKKGGGSRIDGETGTRGGMKEGGWGDNITCVKCRRVCAHRNMFNGFSDCRKVGRGVFSSMSV